MPPVPAVIYAAKSSADLHGSIPTQVADCEAAILREGGRQIIGQPHTDEAASAYSGNRGQGLAAAKDSAAKAALDAGWKPGSQPVAEMWVSHSSRLARGDGLDADHLGELFYSLRRAGVRLRSVENDNMMHTSFVGIAGDQDNAYSVRLRDSVTSGKDRQMKRGERLGGPVPDGLRVVVERDAGDRVTSRRYVLDDDRAPLIREVFALSESGYGDAAIAQRLNRRGVQTQGGKAWSRRRVQDTLTNQTYAARVVRHRGKPTEVVTPAKNVELLIDGERFDAIRAKRADRDLSEAGRERGKRGGRPTLRYAMSRLAQCGRCGSAMYALTSPYKRVDGSQARTYVCANVKAQTGLCEAPNVDAELADSAIIPHLEQFFSDYSAWSESVREAGGAERAKVSAELAEVKARASKLERAQEGAQTRYTDALSAGDDVLADVALEALRKIRSDREGYAARAAELGATLAALAESAAPTDAMLAYWRTVADGVRGRLADAQGLADVNAELRVTLDRVEITTEAADPRLADLVGDQPYLFMRAFYKREGLPPVVFASGGKGRPLTLPDGGFRFHDPDAGVDFAVPAEGTQEGSDDPQGGPTVTGKDSHA